MERGGLKFSLISYYRYVSLAFVHLNYLLAQFRYSTLRSTVARTVLRSRELFVAAFLVCLVCYLLCNLYIYTYTQIKKKKKKKETQ